MEALWNENLLDKANGQNWGKMLLGSVALHLAVFSLVFLIPESLPTRRLQGTIYEVNLVEMPARRVSRSSGTTVSKKRKPVKRVRKPRPAKRVGRFVTKEKPYVIAKRVVKRKSTMRIKPKESPSRRIAQAISKIKRKVETRKKNTVEQAISRIESRAKQGGASSRPSAGPRSGIAIRIYKVEVGNRIKSNWAYPAAFMDPEKSRNLEALVIVKVSRDGTILKSWFERPSGDARFDESVRKAIERSNPLPPFPEGYLETYEEIEINFNLKELEKN